MVNKKISPDLPPLSFVSIFFLSSFFTQISLTLKPSHSLSLSLSRSLSLSQSPPIPNTTIFSHTRPNTILSSFSFPFYLLLSPIAVASFLFRVSSLSRFPFSWSKTNKGNLDDNHSSIGKRSGLQGIPRNDFSRGGRLGKSTYIKEGEELESVRKGKRVTKRHVLDEEFGGDDEDDEIRYLEKLKTSMSNKGSKEDNEESGKKHRKLSGLSNMQNGGSSRLSKGGKRSRLDRESEGRQLEEESGSDGELEGKKKKKQMKESADSLIDNRREITLTTRQRALQSSKDAATGKSFIEFPDGLPPAPPRKQKEKLSELEQQLKKAEAAQRRRMQVEKAARESEAEAIRKILGQDSSRKKREEKLKKRNEELAKEKAANAMVLAPDTVRWVMRPTGTVVTFSENVGLPTIFDSKPHSYPPPRENCVGPSCNNPFRYRDSRSKLPLCSLQCYKAIREKMLAENTPANVAK
ncbi:hypothetical protein I3842_08G089500 [Carya illinoinensis]|uniref:INO80 complex subunit B-like conserved region domain-containing protein n=1 Tax=Carya illinoinensis TaxID=32201 RepID=A0A922EDS3_CARIL|nr:hypothetical protein I3842_08G089500 [Carya illinoinensis]